MERYLFKEVNESFHNNSKLSTFDFFCIVIWKANRAKSKIAKKLLDRDKDSTPKRTLGELVADLTSSIYHAENDKKRMWIMLEDWKFRLPMASAILTVLYPEKFTVYDVRVREMIGSPDVQDKRFEELWNGYQDYLKKVEEYEPSVSDLRDKDRILWAKSFEKQLVNDIVSNFARQPTDLEDD
ncbi:MAG: hypothetical protein HQL31_01275 [Planctomycetes bacterium]|nr:hypothetical protein [Planctomycetota bacterium]